MVYCLVFAFLSIRSFHVVRSVLVSTSSLAAPGRRATQGFILITLEPGGHYQGVIFCILERYRACSLAMPRLRERYRNFGVQERDTLLHIELLREKGDLSLSFDFEPSLRLL